MKLKATFSMLALLGCLTGHAQQTISSLTVGTTPTVCSACPITGNLTVNTDALLNGGLFLGPSIDNMNTMFSYEAPNARLRLQPGWGGGAQSTFFYNDGSVAFPARISIGDVACQPACPNTLGINNLTLAVGGKIGARTGVYVVNPGATWPDYVFSPTYRLAPLTDVARYIQANHHLPDVPSAAQVASEGIELAAMNATLLKKVEELTLYLLQLQAANEALTERVAKLENTK